VGGGWGGSVDGCRRAVFSYGVPFALAGSPGPGRKTSAIQRVEWWGDGPAGRTAGVAARGAGRPAGPVRGATARRGPLVTRRGSRRSAWSARRSNHAVATRKKRACVMRGECPPPCVFQWKRQRRQLLHRQKRPTFRCHCCSKRCSSLGECPLRLCGARLCPLFDGSQPRSGCTGEKNRNLFGGGPTRYTHTTPEPINWASHPPYPHQRVSTIGAKQTNKRRRL